MLIKINYQQISMTMKKIIIILLFLGFITFTPTVNAQSGITIEASQLYASFNFTDASGTNLNSEYSGIFTGAYNAGYRHVLENGIMFRGGIGMRKAGANMTYDNMNYNWNLQYADARLGLGYMYKSKRKSAGSISPYLNVSGYYSYLLNGFQTINNEIFDIKKSKSINDMDYGVLITPGVQIGLSDAFSSYVEFNYLMGLQNLEKDEGQITANYAYQLTLGFMFSFIK